MRRRYDVACRLGTDYSKKLQNLLLSGISKIRRCTQVALCFFYREIRNFTVALKPQFAFFYSEIQNYTVVLKRSFFRHSEIKNLELFRLLNTNTKFLKFLKFAFWQQIKKSKVEYKLPFLFLTTKYKLWSRTQTAIRFLTNKQQK